MKSLLLQYQSRAQWWQCIIPFPVCRLDDRWRRMVDFFYSCMAINSFSICIDRLHKKGPLDLQRRCKNWQSNTVSHIPVYALLWFKYRIRCLTRKSLPGSSQWHHVCKRLLLISLALGLLPCWNIVLVEMIQWRWNAYFQKQNQVWERCITTHASIGGY